MSAPALERAPAPDWTEANQRLLCAELDRLRARLGDGDEGPAAAAVEDARRELEGTGEPAAVDRLARRFALTAFERDLLLLCAGVEMDARVARLCAEAQGEPRRGHATFGLALAALPGPHWSAITPAGPLRRWRMIEIEEGSGLTSARLGIDERILHHLAGVDFLDRRLRPLLRTAAPAALMAPSHAATVARAAARLREAGPEPPAVQLTGDDRDGQRDAAAAIAHELGLGLHVLAAADVPESLHEREALATLWEREATLLGSALLVVCHEAPERAPRLVDDLGGLVLISAREPLALERPGLCHPLDRPETPDQRHLWERALGAGAARAGEALDGVAAQFRLSARRIETLGAELAPALAAGREPAPALWEACRAGNGARMSALAQRIEPAAGWDDLVLPEAQMRTLRQIVTHLRHRLRVHHRWGFAERGARGLGMAALFAGESGTGKTMAAEVLAGELRLELHRIDLSAVVSKYIGETEKNLRRVFDAAEESGAMLLFDEADALFGKRSEVKDSHDRYANIEVSYLLQRMETYRGLAVLTTNHRSALDPAFQRRLRFVVQFPFPDQAQREAIWRGIFPPATPTEGLDFAKLARLDATGGAIRNIALNAAFLAAESAQPVRMHHLQRAAHLEAAKRERPLTDQETRGWT